MIRVIQCWDDGVEDDVRLCDLLRDYGAKASFNLNIGLHGPVRAPGWRYKEVKDVRRLALPELTSVYRGFTIANHSSTHPWPTRIPLAEWKREVTDGRRMLEDLFQVPVSGFAYPFGDYNDAVVETVREAGHVYARACTNATPCHPCADPLRQPTDCHHGAADFWQRYERAKAAGASVFYFWGHSYEFITDGDWKDFESKLVRFNADPDAVWCDITEALIGQD